METASHQQFHLETTSSMRNLFTEIKMEAQMLCFMVTNRHRRNQLRIRNDATAGTPSRQLLLVPDEESTV